MDGPLVTKIEDGLDDDITEEKRFETKVGDHLSYSKLLITLKLT